MVTLRRRQLGDAFAEKEAIRWVNCQIGSDVCSLCILKINKSSNQVTMTSGKVVVVYQRPTLAGCRESDKCVEWIKFVPWSQGLKQSNQGLLIRPPGRVDMDRRGWNSRQASPCSIETIVNTSNIGRTCGFVIVVAFIVYFDAMSEFKRLVFSGAGSSSIWLATLGSWCVRGGKGNCTLFSVLFLRV